MKKKDKPINDIENAIDPSLFHFSDDKEQFNGVVRYSLRYKTIYIPAGVKIVGKHALHDINVEEIVLPNTIKIIQKGAFKNCKQLRRIYLPSSIEIIEDETFLGCEQVEIYCEDEPKEGWLSGEKEEIEHLEDMTDAFNFHRSSGSFDDLHLVKRFEVIHHNYNPDQRPVHTHVKMSKFIELLNKKHQKE